MTTSDWVKKFPLDKEDFLRASAAILHQEGARSEVRLVADTECIIELDDYDNWNGGLYKWGFQFRLPLEVLSRLSEDDNKALCARIDKAMTRVLSGYDNHSVGSVSLVMEIGKAAPDWRRKALRWADGHGINNQGRVRSDNIAPFTQDGLLFRSPPEIRLYQAFMELDVAVAPLPVFLRGGTARRRIEPDFVLIHSGKVMVVEVPSSRGTPRRTRPTSASGSRT